MGRNYARRAAVPYPCRKRTLTTLAVMVAALARLPAQAANESVAELQAHIQALERQLQEANRRLAAAQAAAEAADARLARAGTPGADKIRIGPLRIGGALRVNYVYGDYEDSGAGPQRGGSGGNMELDTFRLNADLEYGKLIGKLEYRWYDGYNFLHTGWLGYRFDEQSQLQAGLTRVPFGPGPYGISQSWFFDQHYYVGLADDMDFGLKYLTNIDNWELAVAWFPSSEGNWNGASEDSARYSYDPVRWRSAIEADGDIVASPVNGYSERNQFNLRALYHLQDSAVTTSVGISLQAGQLEGKRADDGSHWAASVHMRNEWRNFLLASQFTRYEYDLDRGNPLGSDELLPLGAYDFAWPVAAKAWIPALSLSYRFNTGDLPWLDYLLPYIEYSSILKDADSAHDSSMLTLGAAWASGGWYIYTDYVRSNGNLFIGNQGDNYANIYQGVGDFGIDGNHRWNDRFNINFGYYF